MRSVDPVPTGPTAWQTRRVEPQADNARLRSQVPRVEDWQTRHAVTTRPAWGPVHDVADPRPELL